MIDTQVFGNLIETQIKLVVEQQVATQIVERDWFDTVEAKVTKYIQDRITAKFRSLESVPELIDTVKTNVQSLFDQGRIPGIDTYVDQVTINTAIDLAVQNLVSVSIENLSQDDAWIKKIEQLVNHQMATKLFERLSSIDLDAMVVKHIDLSIDKWHARITDNFASRGIVDQAQDVQLVVTDETVYIKPQLVTNSVKIETDAHIDGSLSVNNLLVRGIINTDNHSWDEITNRAATQAVTRIGNSWKTQLVDQVLVLAKTQGIGFDNVTINGNPLYTDNTLTPDITESNIQKIGVLRDLHVDGYTELNQTLNVHRRRVGINTTDPEMALSVWDEEVSIVAGKLKQGQAYVGTSRLQNLAIGINRTPLMEFDTDGLTTIKQLRVGQHRISYAPGVPGYVGTRGDLVFNSDPKPNTPFAWVCLGGVKWQTIKGA